MPLTGPCRGDDFDGGNGTGNTESGGAATVLAGSGSLGICGDTTVASLGSGSTVVASLGAVSCTGMGGGIELPGLRWGGSALPAGRFGNWIPVGGALRAGPRRGGSGGSRRPHA